MSGPIVPPLQVTEVDGSPDGRPITKIIVSNGDLSISGRTATIDTTGSGGTPGGSDTEIQYNDGGAFAGDAGFFMETVGGGGTTKIQVGAIIVGGATALRTATENGVIHVMCDGTGQIILQSGSDAGGTWTDSIVNIMCNAATDEAQLKFRTNSDTDTGKITVDGSGDMVINNPTADKDIQLEVTGTGIGQLKNVDSGTDTMFKVLGVGTPDFTGVRVATSYHDSGADFALEADGTLEITHNITDEDIDLKVLGTGIVKVANQTTNNATTFQVAGNGTGKPVINLTNAAMSASLEVTTDQELTIKGGTESFVFDVSSATGGITWPDGSEQITASAGGGDGMLFCAAPPASGYDYDLSGQSQGSQGSNPTFVIDEMYFMPFSVPTAISAANLTFGITFTTGGFSGTYYVAIYSADANNLPLTLVDSANASISSTGDKTITFSSPVSLSADTLYYASISWDGSGGGGCGFNGGYYEYGRSGLPIDNTSVMDSKSVGVLKYAIAIPPATLTTASITGQVGAGPKIRLGV